MSYNASHVGVLKSEAEKRATVRKKGRLCRRCSLLYQSMRREGLTMDRVMKRALELFERCVALNMSHG